MPHHVALVSSASHQHLDDDLPLLVAALSELGVEAAVVDWHDDAVDWAGFDLAVLRSTWDYTAHLDAFLARVEAIDAATTLANPLAVVRANVDKHYLVRLAAAGVAVVPTEVIEPGEEPRLPEGVAFVVKPTVSAGGRDSERYGPDDHGAARAHASALLAAGRAVLVQPYVDGIDHAGETGMVFVGDRFSHAFRKGPILRPGSTFVEGLYREEDISARTPSPEELTAADVVLGALDVVVAGAARSDLLYARVDLVPGPDGPLLMELELVEPSLFLKVAPGSAERAAAAVAAWAGRP